MPPRTSVWNCPRCKRRVPLRIALCHCGFPQEEAVRLQSEATGPTRTRDEQPFRIWVWVGALVVLLALAVFQLMRPSKPTRYLPLLGVVERPAPRPSPTAAATPTARPSPRS